ncbi:MAG: ATP synthase F1 subunit epsilon [FCB group bacterium]|jgi:F-type H+-transporting ATPase subunit epsilon
MAEDKLMDVEIVTPQRTLYSGKAVSVSVPGSKSPFQILYNHAPIVSSLDIGLVKIIDDKGNKLYFATSTGFTEVHKNKISILVDTADDAETINSENIKEELLKAKELVVNSQSVEERDEARQFVIHIENKMKVIEKSKAVN